VVHASSRQSATTIKGILIPVAWASSGKITCVAVATFDEKEYRVAADDKVDQWQHYLSRVVSVQGTPYVQNGLQWFSVQSLQLVE
jgi:hypothetical protein